MIGECELFTKALCLPEEWFVTKVELQDGSEGKKELHMWLDFKKGTKFKCPEDGCGELAPAYDTREHVWRHLDFFQYRAFIHARVPGVNCPKHGVKTAGVPWARPGSGFTLLFESMAVLLAQEEQEVLSVSRQTGVPDTTLWRILRHYVQLAREKTSFKGVTAIGCLIILFYRVLHLFKCFFVRVFIIQLTVTCCKYNFIFAEYRVHFEFLCKCFCTIYPV